MAVSSANVPVVVKLVVGRYVVKSTYNIGPKTLPCGTPDWMDTSSLTRVRNSRSDKT
jgi:hypothetical protein